jgi:cysteinyl-tRNA synthetase
MRETEKAETGYKKSPLDFTLWKASKPGEPSWESPWGPGRPGWHIECSAMVEKHLPDGADIHGGGTDLRFPHHENELAQSAGAHPERTFVRAWAHHGMVTLALEGQISNKMAKSLGNVLDVERAVDLHGHNAVRMWLLQSHYSQPIDYSEEILEEKRRSYEHLTNLYARISGSQTSSELSESLAAKLKERFDAAMQDDFNTPEAMAAIFDATGRAGQEISTHPETAQEFAALKGTLEEILTIFGFDLKEERSYSVKPTTVAGRSLSIIWRVEAASAQEELPQEIAQIVADREQARQERNWATADRLRDELHAEGWTIEDTPEGPIVSRR